MTFENEPSPPPSAAERREAYCEAFDRAMAEIDRVLALPAGDPELLRLLEGVKCPVPPEIAQLIAEDQQEGRLWSKPR